MKKIYDAMRVIPLGMLALAMLLSPATTQAQSGQTATGVVVDQSGNPVVGVAVTFGSVGTTTGANGEFSLRGVPSGSTLAFEFVGLVPVEANFEGEPMRVVMQSDVIRMEDVIVTGFGTIRKSAFAGSASRMNVSRVEFLT